MALHPISIEGKGFVTEPIVERLRALPGANRALMEVVTSTVSFANDLATSLPAHSPHETPEEKQRVIALALLVRLLEVVESIVILSAHGVRQELKTLFRIFLDAYFLLANVCSDPGFVPVYFRTDEPERFKLLNAAARQDHELFTAINQYVHSGPRCLAEYVEADREGNVKRILHRGDIETTHRVLYDTTCFLLKALTGICELFQVSHTDTRRLETAVEVSMIDKET